MIKFLSFCVIQYVSDIVCGGVGKRRCGEEALTFLLLH